MVSCTNTYTNTYTEPFIKKKCFFNHSLRLNLQVIATGNKLHIQQCYTLHSGITEVMTDISKHTLPKINVNH